MADGGSGLPAVLERCVADGTYSALAGLVGDGRQVFWVGAAGTGALDPAACRFDLASLTKPWTATLALALDRRGILSLERPLGELAPGLPPAPAARPLEALLRHRAGLVPWLPLYHLLRNHRADRGAILAGLLDLLRDEARWAAPPDTYSDLGPILWALLAERELAEPLGSLHRQSVLDPLDASIGVGGAGEVLPWSPNTLPCGIDTGMERRLAASLGIDSPLLAPPRVGESQDGNARFLGGLGGHAGLFGSVWEVWRFAAAWLKEEGPCGGGAVARALAGEGEHRLGWRLCAGDESVDGTLGKGSYGHLGFTGGGVWIDPGRERIRVLLGHRRSPFSDLAPARRAFHRACRDAGF